MNGGRIKGNENLKEEKKNTVELAWRDWQHAGRKRRNEQSTSWDSCFE